MTQETIWFWKGLGGMAATYGEMYLWAYCFTHYVSGFSEGRFTLPIGGLCSLTR